MTQTTFTDNVLVDGSQDIEQLRVQGHTTQLQPIQTWENSAGDVLAQVTSDGRLIVGDDVTPDSLIEAHRLETSTTKPKRGLHSLGQVSGTLATLVQWIVGELELRGSTAIDALHTAFRIRAANLNTGTPTANAELRAADVEVINDATAGAAALPKATGLQVAVTNASGKTITDAAALRLKVNNAGTITNPYAIFAEGPGITHLENFVEIKQAAAPATPATDFMRLYPKSDGKLYAKNWSGTEFDLTASGGGSVLPGIIQGRLTLSSSDPTPTSSITAATTIYFLPYKGDKVTLYSGSGSTWNEHTIPVTGVSASIPATTNTNYDVFLYDNAGALTPELVAWTNNTTRATALVPQNGVWVKSGATTRLYLGTIRTTGVSGQCEQSFGDIDITPKQFVWNYYHRREVSLKVSASINSYAYGTAAWRQQNASALNQIEFVIGVSEEPVKAQRLAEGNTTTAAMWVGIGLDSTTVNSADLSGGVDAPGTIGLHALYRGYPSAGYHYLAALEWGGSTVTFYGDNGLANARLRNGLIADLFN
jgi:hypothetical protein